MGISRFHWITGLLLSLFLLGWMGYQQWSIDHPQEVISVAFDPKCDLRAGPCETILKDGSRVSFGIEPRTIPVAKTLDVEIKVSGLTVEAITLDINGVDMKMPPNRVELKASGPSKFKGQAGLMFCTRDAMEWETVVELKTDKGQINVPYRFITVTNGSY